MYPVNLDFWIFHARGYEGHWAVGTLILGFFYQRAKSVKAGYSKDWFAGAYAFAIITGFVTARLFHFMFWDTENFLNNPLIVFQAGGGFAILGATIGTGFGGWVHCKRTGVNFLHWCDSLMTPICLSLALGRIACFLNGDAYGLPTGLPWGMTFSETSDDWMREWQALHHFYAESKNPLGIITQIFSKYVPLSQMPLPDSLLHLKAQGIKSLADLSVYYPPNVPFDAKKLSVMGIYPFPVIYPRVHPTQLYEFFIMMAVYFFILYSEKQRWGRQRAFFLFWICYGINRFVLEIFRGDRNLFLSQITYAQVIAILLVAGGTAGFVYSTRKWAVTGLPPAPLK